MAAFKRKLDGGGWTVRLAEAVEPLMAFVTVTLSNCVLPPSRLSGLKEMVGTNGSTVRFVVPCEIPKLA